MSAKVFRLPVRLVFLIAATATCSGISTASAQTYPWCAQYNFGGGGLTCGYTTIEQCRATIAGVGGSCLRNPAMQAAPAAAPSARPARPREDVVEPREPREPKAKPPVRARREPARPRQEPSREPANEPVETSEPIIPTRPPGTAMPAEAEKPRSATGFARKPAPPDARVTFIGLKNGATVGSELTLRFGLFNMGVAPAGIDKPGTGHHHVLIDMPLPPMDEPIPNDFNHLHFGAGQTEVVIRLTPGKHTLQLLLGDDNHVPHDPPVKSERIEINVKP